MVDRWLSLPLQECQSQAEELRRRAAQAAAEQQQAETKAAQEIAAARAAWELRRRQELQACHLMHANK